MASDEDEDRSTPLNFAPPRGPARPPHGRPAAPPPPPSGRAADEPLRWGVVAVVHTAGELVAFPGGLGVVRFVSSEVGYAAPPLPSHWRAVPSEPGRYETEWDGDPAAARTLQALRTDLERAARAGKLADRNHPLLRELDETAIDLVAAAARLHQARWGLGLLQPGNVLTRARGEGREAVLTDLGFTWRGSFGPPPWDDSPGRPDWLDPDGPSAWLWDHAPVRQQFADPTSGVFPPADPRADVRTLGRLFAWLLSGQTGRELPAVGDPPPAWAVVADAAAGRIDSAAALADRLHDAALSEYFAPLPLGEEEVPLSRGKNRWLIPAVVGMLALMVGGAVLGLGLLNRPRPEATASSTTRSTDPPPAGVGPFNAALAALDAAMKGNDRAGAFAALAKVPPAPTGRQGEIDARRARVLDDWLAAVNEAVATGSDPGRRFEAADRFAALHAELKQLTDSRPAPDPAQREKEHQCLDIVSDFARQLGPPR